MTDRFAALREALAVGPTPGPWQSTDNSWETSSVNASDTTVARCEIDGRVDEDTQEKYEQIKSVDARYIAAANPATIAELLKEFDEIKTLADRLKQEAQIHAQEARTANATIAEMYQVISGSTGEPGNWNGAEPVRKLVAERDALKASAWNKRDLANRLDVIARGLSANGSDAIVKHRLREIVSELGGTGVPAAIDAATEQPT